jgi:hypothetical protein
MKRFIDNLKRQAEENPILALGIGAAVITAISKFIDASGRAAGSQAYARQVDYRIKHKK